MKNPFTKTWTVIRQESDGKYYQQWMGWGTWLEAKKGAAGLRESAVTARKYTAKPAYLVVNRNDIEKYGFSRAEFF